MDYLNLLLTSIKEDSNEDVSYVLTQEEQKAAIDFITTQKLQRNKVALICESIRNALIKINKYPSALLHRAKTTKRQICADDHDLLRQGRGFRSSSQ